MHHLYQGQDGWDPDLPTKWEADFFKGPVRKFLFLCLQPFIYTLRPMFRQPLPPSGWEIAQWASQICVNSCIIYFWGLQSFWYLLISSFIGASIHPLAAHFVSEHYEWEKGAETYSYYGILNKLTYNVGYHYEHHDFPRIAGPNLPKLKEIASEFYDPLPQHKSWLAVMWRFIFDKGLSPASRTVRPYKAIGKCNNSVLLKQD
jgi:sphingolipid delta-4 desaturase